MPGPPAPFVTNRRVEFCQTDAGGIMHFGEYFEMMEQAEHELLRHIGLSVFEERDGKTISWPRVSAKCDYSSPARFEDELHIRIAVSRIGTSSVTYVAEFVLDGQVIANGELVTVCCVISPNAAPESVPIPDAVVEKLSAYLRG
jgi:4-hydroxybenzoyl-CoA thioesterase/acyl-CoA thioester hydrolase